MKKNILFGVILTFVISSCGESTQGEIVEETGQNTQGTVTGAELEENITEGVKNLLVGTWRVVKVGDYDIEDERIYTFKADGTVEFIVQGAALPIMKYEMSDDGTSFEAFAFGQSAGTTEIHLLTDTELKITESGKNLTFLVRVD